MRKHDRQAIFGFFLLFVAPIIIYKDNTLVAPGKATGFDDKLISTKKTPATQAAGKVGHLQPI